jgi:hypothetical protein
LPEADLARSCEWRIVLNNFVTTGLATAKQSAGVWRIEDFTSFGPWPNEWVRCGRGSVGGKKDGARTLRVEVHGLACKLGLLAADVRNAVNKRKLRIPKRFGPVGGRGTNAIGFVNYTFDCEADERRRKRSSVVIEAKCVNVHGDAFRYEFRMREDEPKPRRKKGGGGGGGGGGRPKPQCEPGYSPCLPVVGDLDCADIPAHKKPVTVTGGDRYRLDADNDGVGCET